MSSVLFTEHPTQDGHVIAEIKLNAERSLNALTLAMCEEMLPRLRDWANDERVVAVLLDSAGEKAFCAGGDVVNLYKTITGEGDPSFPERFFETEYRLDFLLHTYPKPVICWGNGIVMGGGMGLLSASSHRIVTETSRLAMPEVTIGLYPDVGASWFLNRLPNGAGRFLAMTGCQINAPDAVHLGLADRCIASHHRDAMLQQLTDASWGAGENTDAHGVVNRIMRELEQTSQPIFTELEAPVYQHSPLIRELMDHDSVEQVVAAITAVKSDNKWFVKAQKTLAHGSPVSVKLIDEQLKRAKHMSLAEVFQSEMALSVQCCRHREFPEGVRALLIDKDGQPAWTYPDVASVEKSFIDELLASPWPQNPLSDLC
ncbi:enoyl-CoA hydratase/isomerase family protein [Halomonas sp. QX-2]|uniref:3-hydroxyisobutyryl-CoA hydrolase n=1 Tax=Vreelandella sedimenti TaxID=2729618 RepID=A0A7Z0N9W1_9GAMM|nr:MULTISPECIES: enoyl-CoA hydratase/isomerase family protein [Halomonas]NYT74118.1 enoyl-CoA hydratase/isomerase family protein [Halomonas sedimenti]|tara:strand:- start:12537 stop:13652 length:1116 start_codon:yes stop_codon:yes gene_type:complete